MARGIYAVGWSEDTPQRRWMAAVLACGEGAALSHRSAAALWGIGRERDTIVDVTVLRGARPRRAWIRVRRRVALDPREIELREGIPVTCPSRTLIDLATELHSDALERSISEADKHGLIDPESLRRELEQYGGEPGVRRLRAVLDPYTFRLSDSVLEVLFRSIAEEAGLPVPQTKQFVNGFEVDFYWPDLGLVVETDGLRYHRTASAQSRDLLRDQTHVAAGLVQLRFSHHQVKFESSYVKKVLVATAARLRAQRN